MLTSVRAKSSYSGFASPGKVWKLIWEPKSVDDGSSRAARNTEVCWRCIPRKGTSIRAERLSSPPRGESSAAWVVPNSGTNLREEQARG